MKCRGSHRGLHEHDTVAEVRACYGQPQTTPPPPKLPKIHEPKNHSSDPPKKKKVQFPSVTDWAKFKKIPAGYYATPSLTGNNDLDFWRVEKPTEGHWAGYTFAKRVIGGRDDAVIPRDSKRRVKTQRTDKVTQAAAFAAILKYGIKKSNELFGKELKYCRECGIHLTDELSRSLGIGPVCRGK